MLASQRESWRDHETPETQVRSKQDPIGAFERLAVDRINETAAATLLAPPQHDDTTTDDTADQILEGLSGGSVSHEPP